MSFVQNIDILFRRILVPLNTPGMMKNPHEDDLVNELRERIKKVTIPRKGNTVNSQWLYNISEFKKKY